MKKNKLVIFLIIIVLLLVGYIIYNKLNIKTNNQEDIELVNKIKLDYCNIYLLSDGTSFIEVINEKDINKLDGGNNLKDRLKTLYNRSLKYNLYKDKTIKGFKINSDSKIMNIIKIEDNDNYYVVFLKENNTIGLFNYNEYYDLLYTEIIDNYNDYKDIISIKNNVLIFKDGTEEKIYLKG